MNSLNGWFVVLVVFFVSFSEADNECGPGWVFNPETAKCFYISTRFYHFDEAMNLCYRLPNNSVPMMITSMAEKSATIELTNRTMIQPWIGAKRNITDGKFYRIDGEILQKVYWAEDEPKEQNGDCVTYRGLGLIGEQVTQCYEAQPAMCKYLPDLCNGGNFGGQYGRSGSLQSPNFPVQYYNNQRCFYYITAKEGFQINLKFTTYQVEEMFDRVTVYEGNTTTTRIGVGSKFNTDFSSVSNRMLLVFTTNYAKTDIGWAASWTTQRYQPVIAQNGTSGTMSSTNYPNNYLSFDAQEYIITTDVAHRINVTFDDFYTQPKYDYLEIYDFQRTEPVLLANLSGMYNNTMSFTSSINYMKLKFNSNGAIETRGWHLTWIAF